MKKFNFTAWWRNLTVSFKRYLPEILTGFGLVGMAITVVDVAKQSPKFKAEYDEYIGTDKKTKAKIILRYYWRDGLLFLISGGSIIYSTAISANRIKQLLETSSMILSHNELARSALVEQVGYDTAKDLRKKKIEEDLKNSEENKPRWLGQKKDGEILCWDIFTNQLFYDDIEHLKKVQNLMNYKMITGEEQDGYFYNDWFDEIGHPECKGGVGCFVGWPSNKYIKEQIDFTFPEKDEDYIVRFGEICAVLDLNNGPYVLSNPEDY